jgi:hypothetical protein
LVNLRQLLSRLWHRPAGRSLSEENRYADATRLEEKTQSHYRSVTGSDARGRSIKRRDPPDPGSDPP